MPDEAADCSATALLRLQSWLSPAFPIGSYSYSHALEWAVEVGDVQDVTTLIDFLEADLRYGSGRNESILFVESWRCALRADYERLLEVSQTAAALRGTHEFALESSQQAAACLLTLRSVWPDSASERLARLLHQHQVPPSLSVVLGVRCASEGIPDSVAVPAYLRSQIANWVAAGVRLVPLGQTDGQRAIAALEEPLLATSAEARNATLEDLGSAAFMIELASMAHETQYTRLFRS
jgi:urease accessory protein